MKEGEVRPVIDIEKAIPPEALRMKISPDEIDYEQGVESAYRKLSDMELGNVTQLAKTLTKDAGTTSELAKTWTRRLTVLENPDGGVDIVSTYPHGRSGAMLVDPKKPGVARPNTPLRDLLGRGYKPLFTLLRDSPVKNFHQSFPSSKDYMERFGQEAESRQAGAMGEPQPMGFEGGKPVPITIPDVPRGTLSLEAPEVRAFHDLFAGETPASFDDFVNVIGQAKTSRQAINAARKLAESRRESNPQASPEQIVEGVMRELYEKLIIPDQTRSQFVRSVLKNYQPPGEAVVPKGREGEAGFIVVPEKVSEAIRAAADKAWQVVKLPGVLDPEAIKPDMGNELPRFPDNVDTALTRATGIERIPLVGKLWGPRARIKDASDRSIIGYSVKRAMGKSLSALRGAMLRDVQTQLKSPFKQDATGRFTNVKAKPGASLHPSDLFEQ